MAKAVDHDIASTTTGAAWGAAKGGAMGWLASVAGGAIAAIGALALGAVVLGGIAGAIGTLGFAGGAGAALAGMFGGSGLATAATAVVGVIGAGMGAAYGTIPAAIGAVVGAGHAGSRMNQEKQAYLNRAATRQMRVENQMNAQMAEVQQRAYIAGVDDGQKAVVNRLQQLQAQQDQAALTAPQEEPAAVGKFTANCKNKCDSKVEALVKQREAQAATPNQIV